MRCHRCKHYPVCPYGSCEQAETALMADDKDAKQSETEQHVKQIIDDSTMVVSPCATPKKCATALTVRGLGPIGGIGRIP